MKNHHNNITNNIHNNCNPVFFWNLGNTFNLQATIIAQTINIVSINNCTITHHNKFHLGITNNATNIQTTTHVKLILNNTFCFSKETNK